MNELFESKHANFNSNSITPITDNGRGKNYKTPVIAAIILLLLAILIFLLLRPQGYRVIKMLEAFGQVSLDRGEAQNIKVYEDMNLQAGDTMYTGGNGSYSRLVLDDDKYVYVEQDSKVAFVLEGNKRESLTRLELVSGAVINELESHLSDGSSYEVRTPNAVMSVRGTKFRSSVYTDAVGILYTRISVLNGTVSCSRVYPDGSIAREEVLVDSNYETLIYHDPESGVVDYVRFDHDGNIIPLNEGLLAGQGGLGGLLAGEEYSLTTMQALEAENPVIRPIEHETFPRQTLEYMHEQSSGNRTYDSISTNELQELLSGIGGINPEPILFIRGRETDTTAPAETSQNPGQDNARGMEGDNNTTGSIATTGDVSTNPDSNVNLLDLVQRSNGENSETGDTGLGNSFFNPLDYIRNLYENLIFNITGNDLDNTVVAEGDTKPAATDSSSSGGRDDDDDDEDETRQERESETETTLESEEETETESEIETETETEIETESESGYETESESGYETESESESETGSETESESESETEPVSPQINKIDGWYRAGKTVDIKGLQDSPISVMRESTMSGAVTYIKDNMLPDSIVLAYTDSHRDEKLTEPLSLTWGWDLGQYGSGTGKVSFKAGLLESSKEFLALDKDLRDLVTDYVKDLKYEMEVEYYYSPPTPQPQINYAEWEIDDTGKLTVHSGYLSVDEDLPWVLEKDNVRSIVIEEKVKLISGNNPNAMVSAQGMFQGLSVRSIVLTGLDTSNVISMRNMFAYCIILRSIDLNALDTSEVTDMSEMFRSCQYLEGLDLSNFDTSKVTDMSQLFSGCYRLEDLDLSSFDTTNVESMESMFLSCGALKYINVSSFDTSNVTNMQSMFSGCNSLLNLNVSGFDTSNVTGMHSMFSGCNSLLDLDISGFNTSSVTTMGMMFSGCKSLTNLNVSGIDTSNVTLMVRMFSDCASLTEVDTSSFDTSKVTKMNFMFNGCSSLTDLDVSNFDTSSVTDMQAMFYGCERLDSLDLSGFDTTRNPNMIDLFDLDLVLTKLRVSNIFKFGISATVEAVGTWSTDTGVTIASSNELPTYHNTNVFGPTPTIVTYTRTP